MKIIYLINKIFFCWIKIICSLNQNLIHLDKNNLFVESKQGIRRAVGSFSMMGRGGSGGGGRGWIKISVTIIGRRQKILKLQSPKNKFGPENKWFKTSYLEFIYKFQTFW